MKVRTNKAYPINLKVVLAEMIEGDEFVDVEDHVPYDQVYADAALLVVAYKEDAWVIHWLAVRDPDSMRSESAQLTSAGALRLLEHAPHKDEVSREAYDRIKINYDKRRGEKS